MDDKNIQRLRQFSRRRHVIKSFEAKAEAQRNFFERLADVTTAHLGSAGFFISNAAWFIVWIVVNLDWVPGVAPFDPFPFSLLTTIVSLEAIFLSIIVLMSQNREARTEIYRDEIDLQINTMAEEENTKILRMLKILMEKNGIDVSGDPELDRMLKPADTQKIEEEIEKQVNGNT